MTSEAIGPTSLWERGTPTSTGQLPDLAELFPVPLRQLQNAARVARRLQAPGDTAELENGPADYAIGIRDTNRHLIALDSRYGGTGIAGLALQAFTAARTALASGSHDCDDHSLTTAAGETGEIAAWCLYDAARLQESRATTHEAMLISRLAGDRGMELFQLSHLALLDLRIRHGREALHIAENVVEPGRIAPRVKGLFQLRAARALAQAGDRRRALDTLHRAAGAMQDSTHPRDPHWTWWLDNCELACHRGIVFLELGEHTRAMPYLNEAAYARLSRATYNGTVTAHGGQWCRAAYNDLAHLFLALTMAKAWTDAEPVAVTVAAFTHEVSSARTEVMIRRGVHNIMTAAADGGPDRPSQTLLDLAEELAARRASGLCSVGGDPLWSGGRRLRACACRKLCHPA